MTNETTTPLPASPPDSLPSEEVEATMALHAAESMSADEARTLTDAIQTGIDALSALIDRAYHGRAWAALGYPSWGEYCAQEFPRLRLPVRERRELMASLSDAGMSNRALAAVVGKDERTIRRDLDQVRHSAAPDEPGAERVPITGRDGKTYRPKSPPTRPREHRRKPLSDAFAIDVQQLLRSATHLETLTADDRFTKCMSKIRSNDGSRLRRCIDMLERVADKLPDESGRP